MPAPVVSSAVAHTASGATKRHGHPPMKRTRVVRRRGRAKDAFESDEEIEREVGTDSDTEDDVSSLDSASDSDTEPASEDVVSNGRARVLTPNTTRSVQGAASLVKDSEPQVNGRNGAFFAPAGNWSEMVADENKNGPADLPVIDFADFDGRSVPAVASHPTRSQKSMKKAPSTPKSLSPKQSPKFAPSEIAGSTSEIAASTSRHKQRSLSPRRPHGQSARQVYQQRLESDPSYVPKVGEFWGHDDRLLDKDLRSLSGWWRGRWQGRGRGLMPQGRGRSGRFDPRAHPSPQDEDDPLTQLGPNVPPIDRAWTHDGFEEMKRREEHRQALQQQQQQKSQPVRGFGSFRGGRGGFVPSRGRGGTYRGGFPPSPSFKHRPLTFPPGRPWFVMKPERVWTKQHEAFLYLDSSMKPRSGHGPKFRVRLPGGEAQVIKAPLRPSKQVSSVKLVSSPGPDSEKSFVVRLPSHSANKPMVSPASVTARPSVARSATDGATSLISQNVDKGLQRTQSLDVHTFGGAPTLAVSSASAPLSGQEVMSESVPIGASPPPQISVLAQPEPVKPGPHPVDNLQSYVVDSTTQPPAAPVVATAPAADYRPSLPPLQTSFTPPITSPTFNSPYAYGPSLPPGIALNQLGVPYELATGRPVYLQQMPIYNPRPMHAQGVHTPVHYVPSHVHHHSTSSPDFFAQSLSHTPPTNGFVDPSIGTPLFSFPRQTSRIEIRAPSEQSDFQASSKPAVRKPSGLRSSAASFEPSRPVGAAVPTYGYNLVPDASVDHGTQYSYGFSGEDGSVDQQPQEHVVDPNMPGYSSYPYYYYPDGYYQSYVDPQAGHYEYYPPDPRVLQGAGYY